MDCWTRVARDTGCRRIMTSHCYRPVVFYKMIFRRYLYHAAWLKIARVRDTDLTPTGSDVIVAWWRHRIGSERRRRRKERMWSFRLRRWRVARASIRRCEWMIRSGWWWWLWIIKQLMCIGKGLGSGRELELPHIKTVSQPSKQVTYYFRTTRTLLGRVWPAGNRK